MLHSKVVALVLVVSASPTLLGAGCGGDVSFHGTGAGETKAPYKCPNAASVKVTWRGESGSLSVVVEDAMLLEKRFTRSFTPAGVDQTVTQELGRGDYTLIVTRTAQWKGAYTVVLDCR